MGHAIACNSCRRADVPAGLDDARAWLFGTARNCLLNEQRGQSRQGALEVRIAEVTKESTESEDDLVAFHVDLASAWQQLSPDDQEVLSLAMWEALPSPQAGTALGITAATGSGFTVHGARCAGPSSTRPRRRLTPSIQLRSN
jgi:DNA-directed RNA polymerase specialized sigma24 family protein